MTEQSTEAPDQCRPSPARPRPTTGDTSTPDVGGISLAAALGGFLLGADIAPARPAGLHLSTTSETAVR
jgi:hypothetical protein